MKARSVAFQFSLYIWTAVFGLLILPLLAGPRRWNVAVGKLWSGFVLWMLARIVGLDHQVRGREHIPDRPVLFAFKHQSAWETVAANRLIHDPAIVLKRELSFIPFYGWFLVKTGMIAIDRARGSAALRKMVETARNRMSDGRSILTFPEGTRTPVGAEARYHPGIFALYAALDAPVVPVALNSGLFWRRRESVILPGRITVEFLPPIPPGLRRKEFMSVLQDRIETAAAALVTEAEQENSPGAH
jgi:1-acyl-sn-glycerol-3-phosphate acyltransferase